MSIMVAGGLTFAIPSALPQAAAAPATDGALTVSSTEFGGQQIIEIRVNDPDYRSVSENVGQISVTIMDENVQMIQAATGIWYAYVADSSAIVADDPDTTDVTETNGDNPLIGAAVTVTGIVPGAGNTHTVADLQNEPQSSDGATNGDRDASWPFVQLHDFASDPDGEFDVVYRDDERVTLTYDDDLTDSVTVSLDRTNVPRNAVVHLTISDIRLNFDPTGDDKWVLNTDDGSARYIMQTGSDIANLTPDATTELIPDLTDTTAPEVDLGGDHGSLDLPVDLVITPTIANGTEPELATIIIGESGRNTNVFDSFTNNVSPINLDGEADINSRVTVAYAGADATLIVRDESTDIAITSDDFWNSGEPATVTVTAPNLDANTMDDDDVTIKSDLIPTIVIGDPITITDFTPQVAYVNHTDEAATHYEPGTTTEISGTPGEATNRTSINGLATTTQMFAPDDGDADTDERLTSIGATATGMETAESELFRFTTVT